MNLKNNSKTRKNLSKILVSFWLLATLVVVCLIFWRTEFIYSMPTPVPEMYKPISKGKIVQLSDKINLSKEKPTLIHFFNPDCPCSKFNIKHFKSLVKKYSSDLNFEIVVLTKDSTYTAEKIQEKFDLKIPVFIDEDIAKRCGVISTPQAVIIENNGKLFYRGNYNKSRYCTDAKSDYAKMAIDSLLAKKMHPEFNQQASIAYGCELPSAKNCKKN